MKISVLLLMTGMFNLMANTSYSQSTKVTLNLKNASVEEVLNEIEKKSEFYFLFNQKLVNVTRKVDVVADNKTIKDVLACIFKEQDVDYVVLDRQIILAPKEVSKSIEELRIQQKVSGIVTDATSGEPLIGVTVAIDGTKLGTVTDDKGSYSLDIPNYNAVLNFSYLGYLTKQVPVSGQSIVDVKLETDVQKLEEVVVVGYGTVSRKNLTTSIAKINTANVPTLASDNVNNVLLGRAAGLQAFQGTAQPGGKINVSIRGGSGNPLYVVDGVVMPSTALDPGNGANANLNSVNRSGLMGLNPEDIESIEVLKDASAAIYGIDAANGVVMITTKKGKSGNVMVSYDGSHSWVQNYPYYKPLDAAGYMKAFNSTVKDKYMYDNSMGVYGTNPVDFTGASNLFTDAQIASPGPTYNYLNSVLRAGRMDNHTLTFNGGSQAVQYYFSGNYFNQDGTVANSGLEKLSAHFNIDAQFLKILKFGANINLNKNVYENSTAGTQTNGAGQQSYGAVQAAIAWLPVKNAYNSDGTFASYSNLPNPMGLLGIEDETTSSGILGNFTLEAEIFPKMLTAKILYGRNLENSNRSYHVPGDVFWEQMYLTRAYLNNASRDYSTLEGTVNFNKDIASMLKINAVAGAGKYLYNDLGNGFYFANFSDALGNYNASAATNPTAPTSYRYSTEKRSFFGRASFDILDKYIITGTLRYDGDSRFSSDKKYAAFPSVSAAWKVTNESFIKNNSIINLLKIRGSYGVTGSNDLGASAFATINPSADILSFNHGSTTYVTYLQTTKNSPDLTWQKQVMLNGGVDFSILKDRISGSFDVFRNEITNLMKYANAEQLSQLTSKPVNGGAIVNKGYEFILNTVNVKTKDFTWNMSVTASHYYKYWKTRFESDDLDKSYTGLNDAVDVIYYRPTSGIITDFSTLTASQQAIQTALKATKPGYEIYTDTNGDGVVDNKDIKSTPAYPKLYLGFGNTFNYKNISLDVYFYGQFGFKKYNHSYDWVNENTMLSGQANATVDYDKIWTPFNASGILPGYASLKSPVSIASGTYNSGIYPYTQTMTVGTNIGLEDASFMRCRNITLGYTFNVPSWKKYVKGLKLYFDIQNAFIVTKYKGIDPEVYESLPNGGGVKGGPGNYPMARTFSVGIKVNL